MPLFAVYSSNKILLTMKSLPEAELELCRMMRPHRAVQSVNESFNRKKKVFLSVTNFKLLTLKRKFN